MHNKGLRKKRGARLGQHFLTNTTIASHVASAALIVHGDTVLEIGPGKGILTAELLKLGARVIAIEKDSAMVRILHETFKKEIRDKRLEIKVGDARELLLTLDSALSTSYKVAANIPYYITGELIRLCLTAKHQPESLAFLVQREVAERIVGRGQRAGGSKSNKESILSLSVKVYGTPKYVKTISRGNFNPPPNVDSAILSITNISRKNFKTASEKTFFSVVKAGFAQKRKTLGGNLRRAFGEHAESALAQCGIDEKKRAEDVPLEKWLELSSRLSA